MGLVKSEFFHSPLLLLAILLKIFEEMSREKTLVDNIKYLDRL